jgi:microcystin-dependent protein
VSAQPNTGTQFAAANAFLAQASNVYRTADNLTSLMPATVTNTGGSQAHLNMQPFLTLSFAIALQGIFPSPN